MLTELLLKFFVALLGVGGAADLPAPKSTVTQVQIEKVETERVAQVRLAEVLGTADAIHSVRANGAQITFVLSRGEDTLRAVATTRKGEVESLAVAPLNPRGLELGGGLSWLAEEVEAVTAVTRLVADEDGAVTLTTSDGRRYMLIPGRGSGGNAAVEARWGAEWDQG